MADKSKSATENAIKKIEKIKELSESISTDVPSKSLEEHKSDIKGLDLSYDDLLNHAAMSSAWCEIIEFENKYLNLRLDICDKINSVRQNLSSQHDNAKDDAITLMGIDKLASNARVSLEGQIKGRDAGVTMQKKAMAKKGGGTRSKKEQKDHDLVKECWDAWQQNLSRHKSTEAFARDMAKKHSLLVKHRTIVLWCSEWKNK